MEWMIWHGACASKLLCYRACYGGRAACKRLQIEGSYPSADLLLQIESNMRYYPACIPEDCLIPCGFVHYYNKRIQRGVDDGQMPRCDCPAVMGALVILRRQLEWEIKTSIEAAWDVTTSHREPRDSNGLNVHKRQE